MSKQTFTLQRYFNFLKQINHPVKILCVTALKFEQYVISMILVFFETPCITYPLQFLSIKDFRPLGIEIELLIDHITVVVH